MKIFVVPKLSKRQECLDKISKNCKLTEMRIDGIVEHTFVNHVSVKSKLMMDYLHSAMKVFLFLNHDVQGIHTQTDINTYPYIYIQTNAYQPSLGGARP